MARLKLTLSSMCLGSEGRRVSKSGEASKSFFSPAIMYVESLNVYGNRAEQLVVLQLELKAQFLGQCCISTPAWLCSLWCVLFFFSSHSSVLPYIMTVTMCLIYAFSDLSRATVSFLQSSFYIYISIWFNQNYAWRSWVGDMGRHLPCVMDESHKGSSVSPRGLYHSGAHDSLGLTLRFTTGQMLWLSSFVCMWITWNDRHIDLFHFKTHFMSQ